MAPVLASIVTPWLITVYLSVSFRLLMTPALDLGLTLILPDFISTSYICKDLLSSKVTFGGSGGREFWGTLLNPLQVGHLVNTALAGWHTMPFCR